MDVNSPSLSSISPKRKNTLFPAFASREKEIIPALEVLKEKGIKVSGPFPSDTLFQGVISRREKSEVIHIHLGIGPDVFDAGHAGDFLRYVLCLAQSGHQHGRQNGDDRNDDKKFDQREALIELQV